MSSLFNLLSRLSIKLIALLLGLLLLAAMIPMKIFQSGLTTATPVGAYLNNTFPTSTPGQGTGNWTLVDAFPNLGFDLPVFMGPEPGTNRLMVVEFEGRIKTFDNNPNTSTTSTFLDISSKVYVNGESGMLSCAFHPRYGIDSNYVYVFYSWMDNGNGNSYYRVSRFEASGAGGTADPASELVLIQQLDRNRNHQGGSIFFGNDDFLYITLGDEGGSSNSFGTAQKIDNRLYSGVLRIDVDRDPISSHPIRRQPLLIKGGDNSETAHYFIPNSNPWQDVNGGILEEFYAIGLRNPWRAMKDPLSGLVYIGDVGQKNREEVNVLFSGANYQWEYKEGTRNGNSNRPSNLIGNEIPPLYEYDHSNNNKSIIGGNVYRGTAFPSLYGQYIFGDNVSRRIWSMDMSNSSNPQVTELLQANNFGSGTTGLSAFGEDGSGELYIIRMGPGTNGKIFKLGTANAGPPDPPAQLSQLNIFSNLTTMEPENYTIPYELNVPFWSDDAIKTRYLIIPNDGSHDSNAEQITYDPNGEWELPEGAITVKHFEYQIDESNPNTTKKIETRIIVHASNDQFYGLSYKWNNAQTDATLLTDRDVDTIDIATPDGPRQVEWVYPSRNECLTCHTNITKGVLGPQTAQLNCPTTYPQTGVTANQLKTLAYLNIFDTAPDTTNLNNNAKAPAIDDQSASLQDRALAYLNSNCGYCHRPTAGLSANFDARYLPDNFKKSILYQKVFQTLGIAGARIVIPGDTNNSVLLERLQAVHESYAMPPLAKNQMDSTGVALIKEWILSLDPENGSTCEPLDFNATPIQSYAGAEDQGQGYVQNAGNRILVENNGWKRLALPYDITLNTILEFDFASTTEGEEHSIGVDNDNNPDNKRFKLYGTQNSGIDNTFDTYSGSGDYEHFTIPIGQFFTGTFSHLVFNAENDGAPTSGDSFFENIRLHEGNCDLKNYQRIDFPVILDQDSATTSFNPNASATSGLPVSYQVVSGPASVSGNTLNLTGNPGYVIVEAQQAGNSLYEEAPPVQRKFFVKPTGKAEGSGLSARYFNQINLTDSMNSKVDPEINFFWGNQKPDPSIDYSTYSIRWQGELEPPFDGNYSIEVTADDGVRVWIDNNLVIDEWRDQQASDFTATVNLNAWQKVPIKVEYYQNKVYAQLEMKWTHNNFSQEIIPTRFLYPDNNTFLPLSSIFLRAEKSGRHVALKWETEEERDIDRFQLEKSRDGENFIPLSSRQSKGDGDFATYEALDRYPEPGEHYYRVKVINLDGSSSYSDVESIFIDPDLRSLSVRLFPNPATEADTRFLEVESETDQTLEVEIWSMEGKLIQTYEQRVNKGIRPYRLQGNLIPGMYLIRVLEEKSGNSSSMRMLVQ